MADDFFCIVCGSCLEYGGVCEVFIGLFDLNVEAKNYFVIKQKLKYKMCFSHDNMILIH